MEPSSPEQQGGESVSESVADETSGLARAEVRDWVDRILPVVVDGAARPPGAEAVEHPEVAAAEVAGLRARLSAAQSAGDTEMERGILTRLARVLAARGRDLAEAVGVGTRATALGDEPELRVELAMWLESLGDPAGAATVLRDCVATAPSARDAARLLMRIGLLLVRAGDAAGAIEALTQSASIWPAFAAPLEAAGSIAATCGRDDASAMLMQAAERQEAAGDRAAAFETRRRAVEASPSDERATATLAASLDRAGRTAAADQVLRERAALAEPAVARQIHVERLRRGFERGDVAGALLAVIDGGLEAVVEGEESSLVDGVIERTGLHEAIWMRQELRVRNLSGARRAAELLAQARLFSGKLDSPERALEAWIEAIDADPQASTALEALREHASTMRDPLPLTEALIRTLRAATSTREERLLRARELQAIAEERLADPSLALWAVEHLLELEPEDSAAKDAVERLRPRVRLQDNALQSARETISSESGPARLEALRRAASILRGRPESSDELFEVLSRLVTEASDDRRWWTDLERLARRMGRDGRLETQLRARLERGVVRADLSTIRVQLAVLAIRRGDMASALDHLCELDRQAPGLKTSAFGRWILAASVRDAAARADAIERIAPMIGPRLRAGVLAVAGELQLELGDTDAAARLDEAARRVDPSEPRALALHARLARTTGRGDVEVLERASSVLLPTAGMAEALAAAFEREGERNLAFAWTRRAFASRPWEERGIDRLVTRAAATGNPEPIVEVMDSVTDAWMPLTMTAGALERGLRALQSLDPKQAASLALRLLNATGPRIEGIRRAVLEAADAAGQPKLGAMLAERWLASGASPDERPQLLIRLAGYYRELGDAEGESHALSRAARMPEARARVRELLQHVLPPQTGDGMLERESVRVLLADMSTPEGRAEAARACRLLGAALWDLAGDRMQAVAAWTEAALLDEQAGAERLASDLEAFAGESQAHELLRAYAATLERPATAARFLVVSAAIALRHGLADSALESALRAVELDGSRTDALVVIERAADQCGRIEAIDAAYWLAAKGALGRAGRRAAHYRAARELHRRGRSDLAVVHAIQAFDAYPVRGPALQLMRRLGEPSEPAEVLRSLQRAADTAIDPDDRAEWLQEGAQVANASPLHRRVALDMALSALNTSPSADIARLLGLVLRRLIDDLPEERDVIELRLQRAAKEIRGKLEGPRGARVAIILCRQAIECLESRALAFIWLDIALESSGDIDEFDSLIDVAGELARDPEATGAFLDAVLKRVSSFGGPVGPALVRLSSTMAYALDDEPRSVAFSEVAQKSAEAPSDDPFADFGSDSEPPSPPEAIPQTESDHEGGFGEEPKTLRGQPAGSLAEALRLISEEPPDSQGPTLASEPTLVSDPPVVPEPSAEQEPRDTVEAARLLESRGDLDGAIARLESVAGGGGGDAGVDDALCRLYAQAGRHEASRDAADRMSLGGDDSQEKSRSLGRAAEASVACGDVSGARSRWLAALALDASYDEAFAWLERDSVERGDHDTLARVLSLRAGVCTDPEQLKALVGRRAVSLEQLGREQEALAEILETLQRCGDEEPLTRLAAELADRGGDRVAAARLWGRVARVTRDPEAAAAIAAKAAASLLEQGFDGDARATIAPLLELRAAPLMEILVELERRTGRPKAVGDALEELSGMVLDDSDRRARYLVEAADAALADGDLRVASERAASAARVVPHDAAIQFYAVSVRYRAEGMGNLEAVRELEKDLAVLGGRLAEDDAPLHAFLSAEVAGVLRGPEEALSVLALRHADLGLKPLIALGMAERLAELGSADQALPLFEVVLASPELRGVRSVAQVAFAAARAALKSGAIERASELVGVVDAQPGASELAESLRRDLQRVRESSPVSMVFTSAPGSVDEERLYRELAAGSMEAGHVLAEALAREPGRTRDLCAVRRRQVVLAPWDAGLVRMLRDAAVADRDLVHAAALDHVLLVLEGGTPRSPEPLVQHDQPERVVSMLLRGVHAAGSEALGLLWTHAPHVIGREPSPYDLEAMEAVTFGADSPVGRAWAQPVKALGLGRVNVYCRLTAGPIQTAVVATAPPSVVVTGQIEESPELRYRMAFILAATMPANVMLFAIPEQKMRGMLRGMEAAFGPPEASRGAESGTVQLAGALWHALPVRVQRRMNEILSQPDALRYEELWPRALQSARRAGLFVVGDLRTALGDVLNDPGIGASIDASAPDAMSQLCKLSGSAADLVRLATSAEYAEARWRDGGTSGRPEGA